MKKPAKTRSANQVAGRRLVVVPVALRVKRPAAKRPGIKYNPASNRQPRQFEQKVMPSSEAGARRQADIARGTHANATPPLIEPISVVEATTGAMTNEELISRAKHHIGVGETSRNTSFRAAAEDMARAHAQGVKQRDIAKGVGKSVASVNRLLKWREGGGVGAPFADKIVQGVNKDNSPPGVAPTEPPSDVIAPSALTNEAAVTSEGERPAAPAIAQATKTLSDAPIGDYRLPQELNRQDPDRAFQRLSEQWRSIPFRDLLLNSPKAAQIRFLRDVVLPEVGGPQALELLASGDRSVG